MHDSTSCHKKEFNTTSSLTCIYLQWDTYLAEDARMCEFLIHACGSFLVQWLHMHAQTHKKNNFLALLFLPAVGYLLS